MNEMDSKTIVVSPHLDDAVLSCWRRLTSDVTQVVTVFAGIPEDADLLTPYDKLTGATSSQLRMLERLQEDDMAMAALKVETVRLPFLDAQYSAKHEPHELAEALKHALAGAARVIFPSAIGGHADHRATRDAVLSAMNGASAVELSAYADYPYSAYFGWPEWVTGQPSEPNLNTQAQWQEHLSVIEAAGWELRPQVARLDAEEVLNKVRAFSLYQTQYAAINGGPHELVTGSQVIPYEVEFKLSLVGSTTVNR